MTLHAPMLTVAFAVIALAATLIVCVRSAHLGSWSLRAVALEGLRLALVLAGVFTLLQPEYTTATTRRNRPVVAVLYDESASMNTEDVEEQGKLRTRSDVVARVKDRAAWSTLDNRMDVVLTPFSSRLADPRSATDLNEALTRAGESNRDLRAVVLASDGDWNAGAPPAEAARELRQRGVPVLALGVGSATPLPNLAVADVSVPAFAVVDKPVRIPFRIASTLDSDADVPVQIELPGEKPRQHLLRVPRQGEAEGFAEWLPTKTGVGQIAIRIPAQEQDRVAGDNEAVESVTVRAESIHVLLIDSFPRWEYRYLRNALQRDPGVKLSCLLLHPDLTKHAAGRDYLDDFPTKDALFQQDVVILGDVGVGAGQLSDEQCEQLRQLVHDHAAGLVFIPGFRGFQATLADSPLADLLPVELDRNLPKGVRTATPTQLELTEDGRTSLLTRLEPQPAANDEAWRKLPGIFWHAAAVRSLPGAKVLATHASAASTYGRVPIIVTRSSGVGKTLFMGSDGAWRWRKGVEDLYHYRFWSQMVRWMAYQRGMAQGESMRLFYSPDRPRDREIVALHASVMDAAGEPLAAGHVTVQVTAPSGATSVVELAAVADESWGHYSGTFAPVEQGLHKLVATCRETGARLSAEMIVQSSPRELVGRPANFDVLREVAEITRGRLYDVRDMDRVVQAVSALPEPEPESTRVRLWSHPLWGGALVALMGVFWTCRKLTGLV